MLYKTNSNFLISILFVFIVSMFIYLPTKFTKTQAAPVDRCSLTYIVGCNLYYCWAKYFNNANCAPCGLNPPCN